MTISEKFLVVQIRNNGPSLKAPNLQEAVTILHYFFFLFLLHKGNYCALCGTVRRVSGFCKLCVTIRREPVEKKQWSDFNIETLEHKTFNTALVTFYEIQTAFLDFSCRYTIIFIIISLPQRDIFVLTSTAQF